jgi:2-polyprenyl-3-methyl-5-hydroxy-6-metoxy-1,4-benzoquinol methylase
MVATALAQRNISGQVLIDVGCGTGALWPFVDGRFTRYIGVDVVRYSGFPSRVPFVRTDLDGTHIPLADAMADVVVAVETIEHLENPRAFFREMVRLAKPGGWAVMTTPNQLSYLSLLTLVVKKRFSAFQDVHYPTHLTALLEIDLRRMAAESSLVDVAIGYSQRGRVVLTPWHHPAFLSKLFPRALSDNILVIGRKPQVAPGL